MYPSLEWRVATEEKEIFLTFDDGPHPVATPFVLDELKKYNAKASFFCIGKNVVEYHEIYRRILDEGHQPGNHTFNHLNGWNTEDKIYFEDIFQATKYIDSNLFRPPYGRISKFQTRYLLKHNHVQSSIGIFRIIMWDVLSGDFDIKVSPQSCAQNVILKSRPGSIIVFHDSQKAWDRMSYALPRVLEYFSKKGYRFSALEG